MSYQGEPTESQLKGLELISREVEAISTEMDQFKREDLVKLNVELGKLKNPEIIVISENDFKKEK
jgi:hypothetical protein